MTAAAGVMRSDVVGFVYFIRSGTSPFVKIGWAADPHRRLIDLQCGNPEALDLLGTIEGTMQDELLWHSRFSHLRARSEWFNLTDELIDAIDRREDVAEELWRQKQPQDMPETWLRYKEALHERRSSAHRGKTAKLDATKVVAIRLDRRTVRAVALAYGVSKTCIQDIRMRRTWRHVADAPDTKSIGEHHDRD